MNCFDAFGKSWEGLLDNDTVHKSEIRGSDNAKLLDVVFSFAFFLDQTVELGHRNSYNEKTIFCNCCKGYKFLLKRKGKNQPWVLKEYSNVHDRKCRLPKTQILKRSPPLYHHPDFLEVMKDSHPKMPPMHKIRELFQDIPVKIGLSDVALKTLMNKMHHNIGITKEMERTNFKQTIEYHTSSLSEAIHSLEEQNQMLAEKEFRTRELNDILKKKIKTLVKRRKKKLKPESETSAWSTDENSNEDSDEEDVGVRLSSSSEDSDSESLHSTVIVKRKKGRKQTDVRIQSRFHGKRHALVDKFSKRGANANEQSGSEHEGDNTNIGKGSKKIRTSKRLKDKTDMSPKNRNEGEEDLESQSVDNSQELSESGTEDNIALGLDGLAGMSVRALKLMLKNKSNMVQIMTDEINLLKEEKKDSVEINEELKTSLASYEEVIEGLRKQVDEFQTKVTKLEKNLKIEVKEKEKLAKTLEREKRATSTANAKVETRNANITKLKKELAKANSSINQLEKELDELKTDSKKNRDALLVTRHKALSKEAETKDCSSESTEENEFDEKMEDESTEPEKRKRNSKPSDTVPQKRLSKLENSLRNHWKNYPNTLLSSEIFLEKICQINFLTKKTCAKYYEEGHILERNVHKKPVAFWFETPPTADFDERIKFLEDKFNTTESSDEMEKAITDKETNIQKRWQCLGKEITIDSFKNLNQDEDINDETLFCLFAAMVEELGGNHKDEILWQDTPLLMAGIGYQDAHDGKPSLFEIPKDWVKKRCFVLIICISHKNPKSGESEGHYVMLGLYPKKKLGILYDSQPGDEILDDGDMLEYLGLALNEFSSFHGWKFAIQAKGNLPEQSQTKNCGVFLAYYFACILNQSPVGEFNDEKAKYTRQWLLEFLIEKCERK